MNISIPTIKVENLTKSYKDHQVLKGVNFEVNKGSIFALLGSNGAGKTTTIKILATLLKSDSGQAAICGYDVASQGAEVRNSISLTGQFATVDEILTGRENLKIIAALRHLKDKDIVVNKLLEDFRLADAADKLVSTYSGGMRRRLDIAMSMVGSSAVVFLDEPTTGLDPQNRLAMWEIVKSMSNSGITVLLTTQYLDEAEALADHIAILHEGIIIADGTPEELKEKLPQGIVELQFKDQENLRKAKAILKDYSIREGVGEYTLDIRTNGSAKEFATILNTLNGDIELLTFMPKQPTLEDAFLTLIGEKEEENNYDN
jgi:ABC-2 type transport system ATP-binding protein